MHGLRIARLKRHNMPSAVEIVRRRGYQEVRAWQIRSDGLSLEVWILLSTAALMRSYNKMLNEATMCPRSALVSGHPPPNANYAPESSWVSC